MESVNKKAVILALVMALFTSLLIFTYIRKETVKQDSKEYVMTYVAAKILPSRHKIVEEDIRQVRMEKESVNPKAMLEKGDIIGKSLKERIIEGEQILRDRLSDGTKPYLSYSVPEGKRAVSINVNEQIGVSGLVRPGDMVDVIASFDKDEINDKSYPKATRIIIQNVQVLSMGQDQNIGEEKLKELPKTVTLAVAALDAERLVYSSEFGMIRLALRSIGDDKTIDTQGTIRNDLITDKGAKTIPNNSLNTR